MNHFLLAANLMITYRVISAYGTASLASIGIGFRILQGIYIPVIAMAAAMAAIVGQNFGAKKYARIIGTIWRAWLISMVFMICCTVICLLYPAKLISLATAAAETAVVALWLKRELSQVHSNIAINLQPAESPYS
jgi:Na+-driven multidrug efflux pump